MDKKKIACVAASQQEVPECKKIEPPAIESAPMKAWIDENGKFQLAFDLKKRQGNDPIKTLTGVQDMELALSIILHAAKSMPENIESHNAWNLIIQAEHDFKPKDAIEARLVAQAALAYQHGIECLGNAGRAEIIPQFESNGNMAIKLMRVHNETIETLMRYRRGGEQKVTVTHVAEKMAVVNNYGCQGGGGTKEKNGDSPCQQYAEQKPEQTVTTPVASQQCLTDAVGSTAGKVRVRKRKEGVG